MSLSHEEKALIQEALSVYIQVMARQMGTAQAQQLAGIAQGLLQKIDNLGRGGGEGSKPSGITDEWYENVCKSCDKLTPSGCAEKVTEKYPGKCDPILRYERDKTLREKGNA